MLGWRTSVITSIHQAKRQSARRLHGAPPVPVAGDNRSEPNESVGETTVESLKIDMNTRAVVADLLVDIGVTLRWGEAAELRMARPLLAERPAQRR